MTICIVCKGEVDWDMVRETFEEKFERADSHGMQSLTESEQFVIEGKVCTDDCFHMIP